MISIIVPVYKVEPYLNKCIDSIINQTYRDIEIILVDDGSPDRCGEICEEYAEKDSRIRVFHTGNRGLSAARNFGIDKANGQYIGFVDSDDWIEPDMFEILMQTAEESGSEIVQCAYYEIQDKITKIVAPVAKTYTSLEALQALLKDEICSGVWSKLWKKECFSIICFPKDHVYEDVPTTPKIFSKVHSVTAIDNVLYHYVKREDSITNSHSMANLADFWIANRERFEFFSKDNQFNTEELYTNRLLRDCAVAIARMMRWLYAIPAQDREPCTLQIKEMRDFAKTHLQNQAHDNWPLHLRFCIFLTKANSPLVFPFLYYLNQFYRKCQNLKS